MPNLPTKKEFDTKYKWWLNLEKKVKLEQAFAIGCSDKEACEYAEITLDQLYYYTREIDPEFQVKKEKLKNEPILKAKQTVVKDLDKVETAKWYLERKVKNEFAVRTESTGADGGPIQVENNDKIEELTEKLNEIHKGTGITSDGKSTELVGTETPNKE